MTTEIQPMDGWSTIAWKQVEYEVFKLQKRIFKAEQRDDVKTVRGLQRLLMRSWSAKLLAVRRVIPFWAEGIGLRAKGNTIFSIV